MTTKPLSLNHLIRPSEYEGKAPLILMLHGYGSDENDLFSFADYLPKKYTVISVRAPYRLKPMGNAWYAINFDANSNKFSDTKQAKESREKVKIFLKEAIESYNINSEDVTLFGFSQGTILSFATALTYPRMIKNIVGLSGYIDLNMAEIQKESNFDHLNVYNSHGTVDQVIPVDWARKTPKLLKEFDINNLYEEFPIGHGVSQDNFQSVLKWLNKH